MNKVTIVGGGIRTPLVIHGLVEVQAQLSLNEIPLFDVDPERVQLIAALSRHIASQFVGQEIRTADDPRGD